MARRETKLKRRDLLKLSAAGLVSGVTVPWFESLAGTAIGQPRKKSCILLWMDGGPSQQHTFDPKPKGEFAPKPTAVPGIHIVEHLPQLAALMDDLVLVRSMTTEINGHYDAKYFLHTGYKRTTAFEHPSVGCIASSQVSHAGDEMPPFVTIDAGFDRNDGGRLYRNVPGYLGPSHSPLLVNDPNEGLENLSPTGTDVEARLKLLARSENRFAKQFATPVVSAKQAAFNRAVQLMQSRRSRAFDVDEEPESLRQAYGKHKFGRSCLLARRLVEAGVRVVSLAYGRWDWHGRPHGTNFENARDHIPQLDQGVSALLDDLEDRGLDKDVTVIVWGEFGRTPRINPKGGRDHWPRVAAGLMFGGGLRGGQVIGATNRFAEHAVDRPVHFQEVFATLYNRLGIDTNYATIKDLNGRPRYLVDHNLHRAIPELI